MKNNLSMALKNCAGLVVVSVLATLTSCGGPGLNPRALKEASGVKSVGSGNSAAPGQGDTALSGPEAYKKTVLPIVSAHCSACHSKVQAPFFAAGDPSQAHADVMAAKKLDLDHPDKSRLVLRLTVDHHNCWGADCVANGTEMTNAITEMKRLMTTPGNKGVTLSGIVTTGLKFSNKIKKTIPLSASTIIMTAASATIKAPISISNDNSVLTKPITGGKVLSSPALKGTPPMRFAPDDPLAGTATFKFNVTKSGQYKVWALTNGPSEFQSTYYLSIDGSTPEVWASPINVANFSWSVVSPVHGSSNTTPYNLAPGAHELKIIQRDGAFKLAKIVVTDDESFDGRYLAAREVTVLEFDLNKFLGTTDVKFQVEVAQFDASSFIFDNPMIITASKSIHAKDIQLYINDVESSQNSTFRAINKTVDQPGDYLTPTGAAMTAVFDKGLNEDVIKFKFGILESK